MWREACKSEMGGQLENGTGGTDAEAGKGTAQDGENKDTVMRDDGRLDQSHVIMKEAGTKVARLWVGPATAVTSGDMETHLRLGPLTAQRDNNPGSSHGCHEDQIRSPTREHCVCA